MFGDSFRQQIEKRMELYDGIDLFPDCEFTFLTPPITFGNLPTREFTLELKDFYIKLDEYRGKYDIALLSCGGYGNIICNYIFENHHSSAMNVGGVLQMWFGVYGKRWLTERSEVLKLFMNNSWKRPFPEERVHGYADIKSGSYW